jgi:hypothetical protein
MRPETPNVTAAEFAELVRDARQRAGSAWWDARCPAHDDRRASLSFADGDHALIVECHAGCSRERIAGALGRTVADFSHQKGGPRARARRILATYDYRDESGALLFQEVRFEPKDFRLRRPDGKGGWTWSLDGVRRVVYRLDELAEQRRVWLVEGPKDADRLWSLGLPATTTPGGAAAWRDEYAQQIRDAGAEEVVALRDNDDAGLRYRQAAAFALVRLGVAVRLLDLPGLPLKGDVSDWLTAGGTRDTLLQLADAAAPFVAGADGTGTRTEPELRREGFDLVLTFPDGARFTLTAIRDGREGVRGEMTVTKDGRRLSWGAVALSSTAARETLRKKLEATAPGLPWGEYLEETAYRLTRAARDGEPIVTLTGVVTSPTRELMPRLLSEGEPTLIFGDGDTGKSLVALAVAVAAHAGVALPFGLKPVRAVPAAFLDWETYRDTVEERLALIAAGLGIAPPPILYKRMTRPLVDEAPALAAEFTRRGIGLVVIDSKMFAVGTVEGAFHEPITAFYNALRLFAPAASLVLNHVTNDAAKSGGAARPFGGAFAFNGPRLIWEAKRDPDVTEATAIAFTCRKANNLPRRPEPFGLRFEPGAGRITVSAFDLTEAAPQTVAGASLAYRVRLALATQDLTTAELAERLATTRETLGRVVRRLASAGTVAPVDSPEKGGHRGGRGHETRWRLGA